MPTRGSRHSSRLVTSPMVSRHQGQYLTVPSTLEAARANQRRSSEWDNRNILFFKLCTCVVVAFLFCVLTVFVYALLLAKYNDEPTINSDTLLARLVDPESP